MHKIRGIEYLAVRLFSWRRSADVDVGPGCDSGNRLAKGDERYSKTTELAKQCAPLLAVRTQCDINAVTMIESQTAVQPRLTERAHGQSAAELRNEEALDIAFYFPPRSRRDSLHPGVRGLRLCSG